MSKLCPKCGENIKLSRIPIIIMIIEAIIIVFLIIMLIASIILANEIIDEHQLNSSENAAQTFVDDINTNPYYNECPWCPNYGYITGAKPKTWNVGGNTAYYTYTLTNEELSTYLSELEENLFEKNPFSTGDLIVYSRDFNGEKQNISIQISQENKEVTIFAKDE